MKTNPFALLTSIVNANGKGTRFASLTYEAKGSGEIARHTIRLGASVEAAYKKDLATLKAKLPALKGIEAIACGEMIASLAESIGKGAGNNSAYTNADTYSHIAKGIKVHKETGEVHLTGFSRQKAVIVEGFHKKVNSSEKTLAKNKLRKGLLSGKFRQFVLPNVDSARIEKEELIFN